MLARDIMTREVVAIKPENSILQAAQIIFDHHWDGLPVVDAENRLIGILTQYDMVTKGTNIHLPTFLQLMSQLPVYKKDHGALKPELQNIVTLTVRDIMNPDPLLLQEDSSVEDVARTFAEHHRVNPIPIVDAQKKLVGIISRYDLIKLYTGTQAVADEITHEKSIDKKIDIFVNGFGNRFLVVSKLTPFFWKIVSVLFVIVGFVIAMALIIRIEARN